MNNIFWVDVETGGLDPQERSLLSLAMVVTDRKLNVLHTQSFFLAHPVYRVTARAMDTNKLDLVQVAEQGISPETARTVITSALVEYTVSSENGKGKPVLGGHNVNFDAGFLETLVPNLRSLTYHSRVDTKYAAEFLVDAGIYRPSDGLSLVSIARDLGVNHDRPHEAMSDIMTTIEVYRKLIEMVRRR